MEWRSIPGFVGFYEVSDSGLIRRLETGRILRAHVDRDGYHRHGLSINGTRYDIPSHRAVALAFIGEAPIGKPLALHNDGNPGNNSVSNIRWGDLSENQYDSVRHGTHWEARVTACIKRDHPLTTDNTYYDKYGKRSCISCRRQAHREYRQRKRERRNREHEDRASIASAS